MNDDIFHDIFPLHHDDTEYEKLEGASNGLEKSTIKGRDYWHINADDLRLLTKRALMDINHFLRPSHLQQLRNILDDTDASPNDHFVAMELLKNANIAAGNILPMCQDTGTAIIMGKKGRFLLSEDNDEIAITHGVYEAYQEANLRYSQLSPISMFEEVNTRNNLPAQIDIFQSGENAYKLLFMAKGGGSANKNFLFQATPSYLQKERMIEFLREKIITLGTAACPPYHLAVVIGGLSAEMNLKTVKLASTRYLDHLPTEGSNQGHAIRDLEMEQIILEMTRDMGIGAQFGGKYFCHDVRVIRLPRHGASLPIGIGVSCSADRQALGKITPEGVFIEHLERNPARFMPEITDNQLSDKEVDIDLSMPMADILKILNDCPVRTRVNMTGTLIVARDLAHLRTREHIENGGAMPDYFKNHPIYYAGPAKTPTGYASGSFGPTTAGRMDGFVEEFQSLGGSMVMLAKGNRSPQVRKACAKYGGFYLGSIGGPAARLAQDCIKKVECLDHEDLGMEAVWRIEVENFPAFVIVDNKGNDFFKDIVG
jgi:fumarate hydratase class I